MIRARIGARISRFSHEIKQFKERAQTEKFSARGRSAFGGRAKEELPPDWKVSRTRSAAAKAFDAARMRALYLFQLQSGWIGVI